MTPCPLLERLSADHARWLADGRREQRRRVETRCIRLLAAWDEEIDAHFRVEEEVLLPELTRHLPETDAVVVFTLGDHVALRRLIRELRVAGDATREAALASLLGRLEEHFRFEERTLFPVLQETLGCDRLAALSGEIVRGAVQRKRRNP